MNLRRRMMLRRTWTNGVAVLYGLSYAWIMLSAVDPLLMELTVIWGLSTYAAVLPLGTLWMSASLKPLIAAFNVAQSGQRLSPAAQQAAQRHVLNLPVHEFIQTLVLWVFPTATYPFIVEVCYGPAPLFPLLHVVIGAYLTGTAAAIMQFYRTDAFVRGQLAPVLIPDGRVSEVPGVWPVNAWMRIIVLVGTCAVLPLGITALLVGLSLASVEVVLFLLAASVMLGITQTTYLLRTVSLPIGRLRSAMQRVRAGELDTRVPVLSGDALGQASEGFNQMVEGLRDRERVRSTFGRYVSPAVMEAVLASELELGGELREATVLFSDLRGFTTLSERLPPDEIVSLLCAYFEEMVAAIDAEGGTLDKFIGDAVMATFGVPAACPDHAARAVRAAQGMLARLERFNADGEARGRPPLQMGIGVHSGELIAGNIGAPHRTEYTVIGDTVNTASRIESLTKSLGHRLLLSEATASQLNGELSLEAVGDVAVKGRDAKVTLFAVAHMPNSSSRR